mmetsp:Transcript_6464/g.18325  ORF Transcript_6464/g.18325 Transcript_6464/m.18325 type:complete len:203 (-) Transcript_6464:381-989(-)
MQDLGLMGVVGNVAEAVEQTRQVSLKDLRKVPLQCARLVPEHVAHPVGGRQRECRLHHLSGRAHMFRAGDYGGQAVDMHRNFLGLLFIEVALGYQPTMAVLSNRPDRKFIPRIGVLTVGPYNGVGAVVGRHYVSKHSTKVVVPSRLLPGSYFPLRAHPDHVLRPPQRSIPLFRIYTLRHIRYNVELHTHCLIVALCVGARYV